MAGEKRATPVALHVSNRMLLSSMIEQHPLKIPVYGEIHRGRVWSVGQPILFTNKLNPRSFEVRNGFFAV